MSTVESPAHLADVEIKYGRWSCDEINTLSVWQQVAIETWGWLNIQENNDSTFQSHVLPQKFQRIDLRKHLVGAFSPNHS
jgi:hypothetical protein